MNRRQTAFTILAAAGLAAALPVTAQEAAIRTETDGVIFVNILTPNVGVSLDDLARQLTVAMENDASKMPGFRSASVHVSRDGSYVLNYAQWDDVASVDAVVAAIGAGQLPDLEQAFSMASAEFHPYDVVSVTLGE